MSHEPPVSVVIAAHDRAALLEQAVVSVLQSPLILTPKQIIISDNDSQDDTAAVAERYGTMYRRVKTTGPSGTRNRGFELVRTPYVAFLDDDDLWTPGAHEQQLIALSSNAEAAFAYGHWELVSWDLTVRCAPSWAPPFDSGMVGPQFYFNFYQIGAVLFRSSAISHVGGFDERLLRTEDMDLLQRIAANNPVLAVNAVTTLYRQRPASRERNDYRWQGRFAMGHRPATGANLAVGRRAVARNIFSSRGHLARVFLDDASACLQAGHVRDATICLSRALYMSPPHMMRDKRFWALAHSTVRLQLTGG